MTEFKDDPLAQLRANQAVLAARITEIEAALCLGAETTAECCGRGPACGACEPEPVPRWRALVDTGESAIWADAGPEIGLSRVLQDLSTLAKPATSHQVAVYALARIVAICEVEQGSDGWQADPDSMRLTHKDGRPRCDIGCLIDALNLPDEDGRWMALGIRAASWLRDLTDGAQ